MKMIIPFFVLVHLVWTKTPVYAQQELSIQDLQENTTYFNLDNGHGLDEGTKKFLRSEIRKNRFIGLAELHQSQQLSYFTVGLLDLLAEEGVKNFAMEIGPYSAQILSRASSVPEQTIENIRILNNAYGNKLFRMTPLIFSDRIEDAEFIQKASELGFNFWGLDQEFIYSYEMHLDTLFAMVKSPTKTLEGQYLESKEILAKWGLKAAKSKKFDYNCRLQNESVLQSFFNQLRDHPEIMGYVDALNTSWDIYCKNESGQNSNQQRADYMKSNFDNYYSLEISKGKDETKVFVKLGSVHLTKGRSPFGVNDVGKFLQEKASESSEGFLSIRHLSRFRNGKDLIGKSGWENVTLLMELGKQDKWTLTDLRPIRTKIQNGELKADKRIAFEIYSYDLLLIPPNDKKSIPNF